MSGLLHAAKEAGMTPDEISAALRVLADSARGGAEQLRRLQEDTQKLSDVMREHGEDLG